MKSAVAALILTIAALCGLIQPARADGLRLTALQISAARDARKVGALYRVPDLLVAIIWKESSFCTKLVGDDGNSFGCGQVQLPTAAFMAGHRVNQYDLTHDRKLNLKLAAQYLQYCVQRFGFERGIYCYNHGAPRAASASAQAVKENQYVTRVLALYGYVGGLPGADVARNSVQDRSDPTLPSDHSDPALYFAKDGDRLPGARMPYRGGDACWAGGVFRWPSGSASAAPCGRQRNAVAVPCPHFLPRLASIMPTWLGASLTS